MKTNDEFSQVIDLCLVVGGVGRRWTKTKKSSVNQRKEVYKILIINWFQIFIISNKRPLQHRNPSVGRLYHWFLWKRRLLVNHWLNLGFTVDLLRGSGSHWKTDPERRPLTTSQIKCCYHSRSTLAHLGFGLRDKENHRRLTNLNKGKEMKRRSGKRFPDYYFLIFIFLFLTTLPCLGI